jgi:hypothetical protein
MNCKPNELAVVSRVSPAGSDFERDIVAQLLGKVVKVLHADDRDIWAIEDPLSATGPDFFGFSHTFTVWAIGDCYLTPLRGDPVADDVEHTKDLEVTA